MNKLKGETITINDQKIACIENTPPICPYYHPATAKYHGDLIVMPYNYVLNGGILPRNKAVIEKSILIFDEGHNITETAR